MKRYWVIALTVIGLLMNCAEGAPKVGVESVIEQELLAELGVDELNRAITKVGQDLSLELPVLTLDKVAEITEDGIGAEFLTWIDAVRAVFFREVSEQLGMLGKLLFLAMLCVLMKQLETSFPSSDIALLSYSVCFIFLLTIGMRALYAAVMLAGQTVEAMLTIMESLLPMMMFLLATVGAPLSATLFTPLIVLAVNLIGFFMQSVIMPLFLLVAVLDAVNYFSLSYRVGRLAALFRQIGMTLFALGMTLFTGLLALQGVSGGIADGLGLRTAKFAVGNLVPIVGKLFADSVDVIFGASLILKNAIGIFGIMTIGMICLTPLIKLLALSFLMKAGGALIELMGEERLSKCLTQMGNNILLLFAVLLAIAFIFFLTITMIVGVGAMSIMMR